MAGSFGSVSKFRSTSKQKRSATNATHAFLNKRDDTSMDISPHVCGRRNGKVKSAVSVVSDDAVNKSIKNTDLCSMCGSSRTDKCCKNNKSFKKENILQFHNRGLDEKEQDRVSDILNKHRKSLIDSPFTKFKRYNEKNQLVDFVSLNESKAATISTCLFSQNEINRYMNGCNVTDTKETSPQVLEAGTDNFRSDENSRGSIKDRQKEECPQKDQSNLNKGSDSAKREQTHSEKIMQLMHIKESNLGFPPSASKSYLNQIPSPTSIANHIVDKHSSCLKPTKLKCVRKKELEGQIEAPKMEMKPSESGSMPSDGDDSKQVEITESEEEKKRSLLLSTYAPYLIQSDTSLSNARNRLHKALEQTRILRATFSNRVYEKYRIILRPVPKSVDDIISDIMNDPASAKIKIEEKIKFVKREKDVEKKEINERSTALTNSIIGTGQCTPTLSTNHAVNNVECEEFFSAGLSLVILPEEEIDEDEFSINEYEHRGPLNPDTGQRLGGISSAAAAAAVALLDRTRRASLARSKRSKNLSNETIDGTACAENPPCTNLMFSPIKLNSADALDEKYPLSLGMSKTCRAQNEEGIGKRHHTSKSQDILLHPLENQCTFNSKKRAQKFSTTSNLAKSLSLSLRSENRESSASLALDRICPSFIILGEKSQHQRYRLRLNQHPHRETKGAKALMAMLNNSSKKNIINNAPYIDVQALLLPPPLAEGQSKRKTKVVNASSILKNGVMKAVGCSLETFYHSPLDEKHFISLTEFESKEKENYEFETEKRKGNCSEVCVESAKVNYTGSNEEVEKSDRNKTNLKKSRKRRVTEIGLLRGIRGSKSTSCNQVSDNSNYMKPKIDDLMDEFLIFSVFRALGLVVEEKNYRSKEDPSNTTTELFEYFKRTLDQTDASLKIPQKNVDSSFKSFSEDAIKNCYERNGEDQRRRILLNPPSEAQFENQVEVEPSLKDKKTSGQRPETKVEEDGEIRKINDCLTEIEEPLSNISDEKIVKKRKKFPEESKFNTTPNEVRNDESMDSAMSSSSSLPFGIFNQNQSNGIASASWDSVTGRNRKSFSSKHQQIGKHHAKQSQFLAHLQSANLQSNYNVLHPSSQSPSYTHLTTTSNRVALNPLHQHLNHTGARLRNGHDAALFHHQNAHLNHPSMHSSFPFIDPSNPSTPVGSAEYFHRNGHLPHNQTSQTYRSAGSWSPFLLSAASAAPASLRNALHQNRNNATVAQSTQSLSEQRQHHLPTAGIANINSVNGIQSHISPQMLNSPIPTTSSALYLTSAGVLMGNNKTIHPANRQPLMCLPSPALSHHLKRPSSAGVSQRSSSLFYSTIERPSSAGPLFKSEQSISPEIMKEAKINGSQRKSNEKGKDILSNKMSEELFNRKDCHERENESLQLESVLSSNRATTTKSYAGKTPISSEQKTSISVTEGLQFFVPKPPSTLSKEASDLVVQGNIHKICSREDKSKVIEYLIMVGAAIPIPNTLMSTFLKERLTLFSTAGLTSTNLPKDLLSATIKTWLWAEHSDCFQRAFAKSGRIDVHPECKWLIQSAIDTSLCAIVPIQSSWCTGKDEFGVATAVCESLMKQILIDEIADEALPNFSNIAELLDRSRLKALQLQCQERILIANLIARCTMMSDHFANVYVSSVVRADVALGHENLCDIVQDESTGSCTLLPHDILSDMTGAWEDPCRPRKGFSPGLNVLDLTYRAHARAQIHKSLFQLQEKFEIKGGVQDIGSYFDGQNVIEDESTFSEMQPSTSTTLSRSCSLGSNSRNSTATLSRSNCVGSKRRKSESNECVKATIINPVSSASAQLGGAFASSPFIWDYESPENMPYGGRMIEKRKAKRKSIEGFDSFVPCKKNRTTCQKKTTRSTYSSYGNTDPIEWSDIAVAFKVTNHNPSPPDPILNEMLLKNENNANSTAHIFAPVFRKISIDPTESGYGWSDDDGSDEEDISEDTVLKRHQMVLDSMKHKVI